MKISEYVTIDETNKTVSFFGSGVCFEVEDLDAWVSFFWENCNRIVNEIGCVDSYLIEKEAFYESV